MMKMAQQTQQPKQATQQEVDAMHEKAGMVKGSDANAIKQRALQVIEESGFLKKLTPKGLKDLTQKIQEFAELAIKGDTEALKNHPITKLLQKIEENATNAQAQQQPAGPAPQQGPTNFAGMVKPPMGGGMSGR